MARASRIATACLVWLTLSVASAFADELTYFNDRFGTRFILPAHLFDQIAPPPENGDGITLTGEGGTLLAVFGAYNSFDETARQMRDRFEEDRKAAGDSVTYRASGQNWLVLSGYTDDMIYYERHELGPQDTVHSVVVIFPPEDKPRFEPFIDQFAQRLSHR